MALGALQFLTFTHTQMKGKQIKIQETTQVKHGQAHSSTSTHADTRTCTHSSTHTNTPNKNHLSGHRGRRKRQT